MTLLWRCSKCNANGKVKIAGTIWGWLDPLAREHLALSPKCETGIDEIVLIAPPEQPDR